MKVYETLLFTCKKLKIVTNHTPKTVQYNGYHLIHCFSPVR